MQGVYEPCEDSFFLLRHLRDYARGKSVLDMGTGSGVLAEEALKYASSVTACDSNPKAVRAARERLGNKAKVFLSDLFSKVEGKFGLIIFNPPYLPKGRGGNRATDGGVTGRELIMRFLRQARPHLTQDGRILLVSSSMSGLGALEQEFLKSGYSFSIVERERHFFEELVLYELRA